MAEGGISASQESLPLTPETCQLLFQQLIQGSFTGVSESSNSDETVSMPDEFLNEPFLANPIRPPSSLPASLIQGSFTEVPESRNSNETVYIPDEFLNEPFLANPIRPPSSLPASENWPGDYDFRVSFRNYENIKGVNWIFAKDRNKLFVGRDVSCPIQFSTSRLMPSDVIIRAMALFSSSEHATEVVTRCVNHSMQEIERGISEAEHLIRCEAPSAFYNTDQITKRHSVVIPYENPAVGEQFSSYLFKFMCFGSCAGGPNRRPLMLVFTLEKGGYVIGRQKVELKVCACPARDYRSEEKMLNLPPPPQIKVVPAPKPSKRPHQDISDATPQTLLTYSQMMEIKPERERGEEYIIKVSDKPCYDFLQGMKRLFRAYVLLKKKYPNAQDFTKLFSSLSSRSE